MIDRLWWLHQRPLLLGVGLVLAQLCILLAVPAMAAPAAETAGRVVVAVGEVQAINAEGEIRQLKRRSPVYAGDTLRSGTRGRAQIRFSDGGLLSLRPDTELELAEYSFSGGAGTQRQNMRLQRGGFRTISGKIGANNREAYRVSTPLAVIGIRGTEYGAFHEPTGDTVLGVGNGAIDATSVTGSKAVLGAGGDGQFAKIDPTGRIEILAVEPPILSAQPSLEDEGGEEDEDSEDGEGEGDGEGDGDSEDSDSEDSDSEDSDSDDSGSEDSDSEDSGSEDSDSGDSDSDSGGDDGGDGDGGDSGGDGGDSGGDSGGGDTDSGSGGGDSADSGSSDSGSSDSGSSQASSGSSGGSGTSSGSGAAGSGGGGGGGGSTASSGGATASSGGSSSSAGFGSTGGGAGAVGAAPGGATGGAAGAVASVPVVATVEVSVNQAEAGTGAPPTEVDIEELLEPVFDADTETRLRDGNLLMVTGRGVGGSGAPETVQGGLAAEQSNGAVFAFNNATVGFGGDFASADALLATANRFLNFGPAVRTGVVSNAGGLGVTLGILDGRSNPYGIYPSLTGDPLALPTLQVPFAIGQPTDLADLGVTQFFVLGESVVRSSAPNPQLFGEMFIDFDLGSGIISDGFLDVALSGDAPPGSDGAVDATRAFIVDFTGSVDGPLLNLQATSAVYQNLATGVVEQPLGVANLTGFVTGSDPADGGAQGLVLAFDYRYAPATAFATGTGLFLPAMPPVVEPPPGPVEPPPVQGFALTQAERDAFALGRVFIGVDCCGTDTGVAFGRVADLQQGGERIVLGFRNDASGEALPPSAADFLTGEPQVILRNGGAPVRFSFNLGGGPERPTALLTNWVGMDQPIIEADPLTGDLLDSITRDILFASALPADMAALSAATGIKRFGAQSDFFRADGIGISGEFLMTLDLGSGAVDGSLALFDFSEDRFQGRYDLDFGGGLDLTASVPGLFADILFGAFEGVDLDGDGLPDEFGELDLASSSLGLLFTGDPNVALGVLGAFDLRAITSINGTAGAGSRQISGVLASQQLPAALTSSERDDLSNGFLYVATTCCQPGDSVFFGRAVNQGGQDTALTVTLDTSGDPVAPGNPNFLSTQPTAVARRAFSEQVVFDALSYSELEPPAFYITWRGTPSPVLLYDAVSGAELMQIADDLIFATALGADMLDLQAQTGSLRFGGPQSRFSVNGRFVSGQFSMQFDLGSGAISAGAMTLFDFDPQTGLQSTFETTFDGSIDLAGTFPGALVNLLDGSFTQDTNFDGQPDLVGSLDLMNSAMGLFLAGNSSNGFAVNGAFNLLMDLGQGDSRQAAGTVLALQERLALVPEELDGFSTGYFTIASICCDGAPRLIMGPSLNGNTTFDNVVLGFNVNTSLAPLFPGDAGFAAIPPDRIFRRSTAELNFQFPGLFGRPGEEDIFLGSWTNNGAPFLEIDATTGEVISEVASQIAFITALPADVASLQAAGGSLRFGGQQTNFILADRFIGGRFAMVLDLGSGAISSGFLQLDDFDQLTGQPAGTWKTTFDGQLNLAGGFPGAVANLTGGDFSLDTNFDGMPEQQAPIDLVGSSLGVLITGSDTTAYQAAGAFNLLAAPGGTLQQIGGVFVAPEQLLELTPEEAAGFGAGFRFIGVRTGATSDVLFGLANDPNLAPTGFENVAIGYNPDLADRPLAPGAAGFAASPPTVVLRNSLDPAVTFFTFGDQPGRESLSVVHWQGLNSPILAADASTGSVVEEIFGNLLFLTALPADIAALQTRGRVFFGGDNIFYQGIDSNQNSLEGSFFATLDLMTGQVEDGSIEVRLRDFTNGQWFARYTADFDGAINLADGFASVSGNLLAGQLERDPNTDAVVDETVPLDLASSTLGFFVTGSDLTSFGLAGAFHLEATSSVGVEAAEGVFAASEFTGITPDEVLRFGSGLALVGAVTRSAGQLNTSALYGLAADEGLANPLFAFEFGCCGSSSNFNGDPTAPFFNMRPAPGSEVLSISNFVGVPGTDGLTLARYANVPVNQRNGFFGETVDSLIVALGLPADPANLIGFATFQGSTIDGTAFLEGDAFVNGAQAPAFQAQASLFIDFDNGNVFGGELFVIDEFGGNGPLGYRVPFSGFLDLGQPGGLNLFSQPGTYHETASLQFIELSGFLNAPDGGALAISFSGSPDDISLNAVAAGVLVLGQQPDLRLPANDANQLGNNLFGFAVYNPISQMPGFGVDPRFGGIDGAAPGLYFGRTSDACCSPILAVGNGRRPGDLGFHQPQNDLVIRQGTAIDSGQAAFDVTSQVNTVGSFSGIYSPVNWGGWSANPGSEVNVQTDPLDTRAVTLIDRDTLFLSAQPTDTTPLRAIGSAQYGGRLAQGSLAVLGQGGPISDPQLLDPVTDMDMRLDVDFITGAITNGLISVAFVSGPAATNVRFDGVFDGRVVGGLADLNLLSMDVFQNSMLFEQANLPTSGLQGLFTGPNGEAFVSGFNFNSSTFHVEGVTVMGRCISPGDCP